MPAWQPACAHSWPLHVDMNKYGISSSYESSETLGQATDATGKLKKVKPCKNLQLATVSADQQNTSSLMITRSAATCGACLRMIRAVAAATAFSRCPRSALQLCKLSQQISCSLLSVKHYSMSCEDFYSVIRAETGVYKYYCNGQWLVSTSGKSVPVINPTTQEKDYAVQGEWCARDGRGATMRQPLHERLEPASAHFTHGFSSIKLL